MITSGTEFGLRLMRAVGAQMGVTYLSTPISTGWRDLMLMKELGVSRQELRERFAREHRTRVIGPNEREAVKFAQMVRQLDGNAFVVNPGELFVPGWTQADYVGFWEEIIRSFCMKVALAPGWEFSAGGRFEATISLQTNLRLIDLRGRELAARDLAAIDTLARAKMRLEGFGEREIEEYIPYVDFEGLDADPAKLADHIAAFSDIAMRHNDEIRKRNESESS